jgi:hypothetical protein
MALSRSKANRPSAVSVSGARGGLGGTSFWCVGGMFQDSAMLNGVLAKATTERAISNHITSKIQPPCRPPTTTLPAFAVRDWRIVTLNMRSIQFSVFRFGILAANGPIPALASRRSGHLSRMLESKGIVASTGFQWSLLPAIGPLDSQGLEGASLQGERDAFPRHHGTRT